jgi:hypothetical protein
MGHSTASGVGHSATAATRGRHSGAAYCGGAECGRRGDREHCLTHAISPLDVHICVLRKENVCSAVWLQPGNAIGQKSRG